MSEKCAKAGRQLQMQIWINDGFDFPPGDAGGRIQKVNPALKQQMLKAKGKNKVEIVELDWGFPAFEEPESSELFIKLVYEEYYKRLNEYFGNGITGFFSDTDCRRINAHVLDKLDGNYYPWSSNFALEFFQKYGYSLELHLPDIVRERADTKIKADYWALAGELYCRWFRKNYEWCRTHGVLYSFHSSDTGPFNLKECKRSSIFAEGSFLKQARFCDYPGTDHELLALDGGTHYDSRYYIATASWGGDAQKTRTPDFNSTKFDLRAKYAASAAYLYNRKRVLCEAFAATNWGATHQDLRRIATWQIMQGINFFVPHAVHHSPLESTRYFAPPEFLWGSLRNGLCEFNNFLTKMCFVASQGKLAAPIAVLDPTEAVWRDEKHVLFDLCNKLNRMPVNYIIVDEDNLREKIDDFNCLILPEVSISEELNKLLKTKKYQILNADELHKLSLPKISFDGGDIHFMHRILPDSTQMLLAANVWSDKPLTGSLFFNNKTYSLVLEPGEIAVFGDPYESYHQPSCETPVIALPDTMSVQWHSDNVIPLPAGFNFEFRNSNKLPELTLLLPEGVKGTFDQQPLNPKEKVTFLGESYHKTILPDGGNIGSHFLNTEFSKLSGNATIYLTGNFDAAISTENDFFRKLFEFYNMKIYLPEKMTAQLSKRSDKLELRSWGKQGAPFYSGSVTYTMEFNHNSGKTKLILPEIKGVCSVKLSGQEKGMRIWPPFEYELEPHTGTNLLEITVTNTLANLLEYYNKPSGILCSESQSLRE
jgi:hypothetical protein